MASFIDETTSDAFDNTRIEIDSEYSKTTTTTTGSTNFEELFYDSGVSSDSSFSSCPDSFLSVSTSSTTTTTSGATNFDEIFCPAKKSPELPSEYFKDLDDEERSATESLNSSRDFDSFKAEPCGRQSPLMDVTNSSQNSQSSLPAESPVSRKSARIEQQNSRKRKKQTPIKGEMFENLIKRLRPQFHRAFSTSELEINRNYDSSPDATTTKYSLKVVNRIRSNDLAFRRIDSKYLADLINDMGERFYEQYILIDCRYPFEFNGGHIKGAINLYDPELLHPTFYPSESESNNNDIHSKKPIFYCEFSSVRGPNMANALRELDRRLNHDNYPHIDYNEIYVLSEGYRHFYLNENVQTHCEPPSYISMNSSQYMKELRKYPFHKKSECLGLSIRSRSTNALVRPYAANLSPCFCRTSMCTCTKTSLSQSQPALGSKRSTKKPTNLAQISPPPFCLDTSFFSCNPP